MNSRTRLGIVLLIALSTASLSSYAVYRIAARPTAAALTTPMDSVVIATRAVPMGTRLTTQDVRVVEWPASHPVRGSFKRVDQVLERALTAPVVENEPLTETKLASRAAGAGLASAIPPGQRALSIRVNEVIGVAGFVVPGTHVDVIATLRAGQDASARVLVSNVRVLASGTRYDLAKPEDLKPTASTVVTLAVTPEQAKRIALAQAEGQLTLTMRNPLDTGDAGAEGVQLATLRGVAPAGPPRAAPERAPRPQRAAVVQAAAPPPPVAPAKPGYMVETIVAGKRSEDALKSDEPAAMEPMR